MKTNRIGLRTSKTDNLNLGKAAKKLHEQTGEKHNASKTIRTAIELAANQEPELFLINRPAIRDIDLNISQGQTNLQSFISEFQAVAGKPLTLDEVQGLFGEGRYKFGVADHNAIKELVINKLVEGKSTVVGGLKLSESMLKSLVVVPDLEHLFEIADKVFKITMVLFQEQFYWNCYSIADVKVIIVPEQVEQIKNQFRCYAETAQERQKLARVKNLCRVLDSFLTDIISPEKLNLAGICYFDPESSRMEPSEQYVKYGLTPTFKF
jgi:hypothetical protein